MSPPIWAADLRLHPFKKFQQIEKMNLLVSFNKKDPENLCCWSFNFGRIGGRKRKWSISVQQASGNHLSRAIIEETS